MEQRHDESLWWVSGGAQLSLESCQAAGLGLLASLPLAALKAGTWFDAARRTFTAIQDIEESESDVLKPLLERMSALQVWSVCTPMHPLCSFGDHSPVAPFENIKSLMDKRERAGTHINRIDAGWCRLPL